MAWEWVPPVATAVTGISGVAFTWLAGLQGRRHTEKLASRAEEAAKESRLWKERRDAYFALLQFARVEIRRARYKRESESKLAELEEKWPKRERISLETSAITAVGIFGSDAAREILENWQAAGPGDYETRLKGFYRAFEQLVRRECGVAP